MEKIINGIRMEIPDDATRETLLRELRRPDDSLVYEITPDGEHRVLERGHSMTSAPSERIGILDRFRTGRGVLIDGVRMDIPDDTTRDIALHDLQRSDDSILYGITPTGEHRVLNRGDSLASVQCDRFGTVTHFITGIRDSHRINAEIKLLEQEYGAERIVWPPDYSWIMLKNWKLPPEYNATQVNIIVPVPDHYGNSNVPYHDFFVPNTLRLRHNGDWVRIPDHYFDRFPYSQGIQSEMVSELERQDWAYVCVHPEHWTSVDTIITFLSQVYTFLSDPFRNW